MVKSSQSASSKRWLARQHSDFYTKLSKQQGLRSRAAFKLQEIQDRDKVFSPGMTVVDLGAAPGGWSQVAAKYVVQPNVKHNFGRVVALDLLDLDPIDGVEFIKGDFTCDKIYAELMEKLNSVKVDVVISDMAPNFCGIYSIDVDRALYLAEMALDFADKVLSVNYGCMLVKVFQGAGFEQFLEAMKGKFAKVVIRKPKASRTSSREVYILGKQFKG